jgi:hypothetical protein
MKIKLSLLFLVIGFVIATAMEKDSSQSVSVPATTVVDVTTTTEVVVPTTKVPVTTVPAPVLFRPDESGFVVAMYDSSPITMGIPRNELLDTGYATCTAFDSGVSLTNIIKAISDSAKGDVDIEDMLQWIAVNAVVYLCPEHESKFDSLTT